MKDINITMYTKANCPNCVTAKLILDAAGLKYADVDIEVGERLANLLKEFPSDLKHTLHRLWHSKRSMLERLRMTERERR